MSLIQALRAQYPQYAQYSDEELSSFLTYQPPPTVAPAESATTDSDSWQITKGLKAGIDQTQALGYGLLGAAGDAMGADALRDYGVEGYQRNMEEAQVNAPNVAGFTDISGVGEALDWASYTLGNLAPTMATALAGGGVGGLVGKKLAQTAATNLMKQQLAKGVSREVAVKTAGELIAKRVAAGQGLGAYAASSGMETGSIYGETGDAGVSFAHGAVAGAFDALPIARVLGKFGLSGAAKDQVQRSVMKEIAKQGGLEAGTEALQTLVEQHAKHWVDTNGQSLLGNLGEANWKEIADAAAAGALGGGVMGGGVGLLTRKPMDDAQAKIQAAGEQAAAAGGDALDQEIAKAHTATQEIPKVAEAETAQQQTRADRMAGIDGMIITAGRMGFTDEEVMLRRAKALFQQADVARERGNHDMASRFAERGNRLYQSVTEASEPLRSESSNYPVPHVAQGEVTGGDLVPSNNPNWMPGQDDISGQATVIPTPQTALPNNSAPRLPPDTEQINMGRDRPERAFAPTGPVTEGIGRNVVERQAQSATGLPQGNAARTITQAQLMDMQSLRKEGLRTKLRERTPAQVEAIQAVAAVQAGDLQVVADAQTKPENLSTSPEPVQETPESIQNIAAEPDANMEAKIKANMRPRIDIAGEPIDNEWSSFTPESGTLNVPRSEMPQVKAEHRGALVNYLNARGIEHEKIDIDPAQLKPTQREFSPAKVQKAREYDGGERSILVSSDGHVVDGHHQWLAKRDTGEPMNVIQLKAPISDLVPLLHDFPSSEVAGGSTQGAPVGTNQAPAREAPTAKKAPKKNAYNRQPDAEKDDLLTAISLLGGINRTHADGVDPADFGRRIGIRYLFPKNGGSSIDEMAENLEQYGYVTGSQRAFDLQAKLDGALRGETVLTPEAQMRRLEQMDYDDLMVEAAASMDEVNAQLASEFNLGGPEPESQLQAEWVNKAREAGVDTLDIEEITFWAATEADVIAQLQEKIHAKRSPQDTAAGRLAGQTRPEEDTAAAPAGYGSTARPTDPAGEGQDDFLSSYTEADLRARAERDARAEREAETARKAAEAKAQADAEASDFSLAGSNRPADIAASQGQEDIFASSNDRHMTQAAQDKAPTPSKPTETPPEKIDDFGQVLEGARKHTASFRSAMDEAINVREVPLSKSFPAPDYEKLAAGGVDPRALAFIASLRNAIKIKPRKGYKLNRWADDVEAAREAVQSLLSGDTTPDALAERMKHGSSHMRQMPALMDIATEILPSQIKDLGNYQLSESHYSIYRGEKDVNKFVVTDTSAKTGFGGMANQEAFDTLKQAKAYIKSRITTESDTGAPLAKFDIWTERGKDGVFLGKKVAAGKFVELKRFDSADEARQYRKDNNAELVDLLAAKKKMRDVRRADNAPRVGEDHRNGEGVTPQQFGDAFGFRGVQFGNWVENSKRQQDLNQAYDGLMDLAAVIGVPAKALSLNGELGLAFGARGTGGLDPAKAHYEPSTVVINLTKKDGAGSLAHEWWHAVDNYFGRMDAADAKAPYLTEAKRKDRKTAMVDGRTKLVPTTAEDFAVRQEVYDAFKAVEQAIAKETQIARRSKVLDRTRSKDYWSTVPEMTARTFERYVIERLGSKGGVNDYLANIVDEDVHKTMNEILGENEPYAYPLASEMAAVNKAYDRLFDTLQTKETESGTALYSRTPNLDMSRAARMKRAKAMGFDTDTVWYHGTTKDFAAFQRGGNAKHSGSGDLNAAWLSSNPNEAAFYAGYDGEDADTGGNLMPILLNKSQIKTVSAARLAEQHGSQDRSEVVDGRTLYDISSFKNEALEQAVADGFKGVIFTGGYDAMPVAGDILAVTSPEVLRSTSAAFDPKESDSADLLYSRADDTGPTIAFEDAQRIAGDIVSGWKNAPDTVVVQSESGLPSDLQQYIKEDGASGQIDGVFHKGKVYLIADNIKSEADLQRILFHEALGHYGLRQIYGGTLELHLDQLWKRIGGLEGIKRLQKQYGFKLDSYWDSADSWDRGQRQRMMVDELIAHIAGTGKVEPTLMQKIVHLIRQGLNRLFGKRFDTLSDVELLRIVAAARNAVTEGESTVTYLTHDPVFVNMFHRAMYERNSSDKLPENGAQGNGMSDSDEDRLTRAQELGFDTDTVWYHGSDSVFDGFDDSHKGKNYSDAASASGFFFSNSKDGAGFFGENITEHFVKPGRSYEITDEHMSELTEDWLQGLEDTDPKEAEFQRSTKAYENSQDVNKGLELAVADAFARGYDSAHYTDPNDETWMIVKRASNIRSVDDSFSPEGTDSPRYSRSDSANFAMPDETLVTAGIRKIADKFKVLKDLQANIRTAGGTIDEAADAYMAEELFHGKAENDLRQMRETLVEPLAKKMAEFGISQAELDQYLYAKHAAERNAHIAKINPDMPDGGSGMTNAEADTILNGAAGKQAQYDQLARIVYDMLAARRDTIRAAGLESDDLIDAWEASYQHYVPLKGWAEDEQQEGMPRTGKGLNIGGKESKRAMGRSTEAASPSSYAIQDLTETLIRKRKNEVGNAFLELVKANPNKDYWQVFTDANPETDRRIIKRSDGTEEVVERAIPMAMMSDRYFQTKKDGVTHYIKLEDPRLMKAMKNIGPDTSNFLIRSLGAVNRFLSSLNTSFNPEFVVGNFARDIQTAVLNLSAEQSRADGKALGEKIVAKTLKDVPKAMRAVYRGLRNKSATNPEWAQWFDEFREAGAKTGYFDMQDIDGQSKEIENLISMAKGGFKGTALKWGLASKQVVEDINGAVENAVRLSAYVNARKAGIGKAQAASLAKNMTVNFNRRGEVGTTLNALYMFANASIQGSMNFARTMIGLKGQKGDAIWSRLNTAQKISAVMMAGAYGLAMANRMAAGDDDDGENWYDKVPGYVKERNIVIMKSMLGGEADGSYWKIPLPYGYNIFHVVGTSAEAVSNGTTPVTQAATDMALAALGSFSPIGFQDSQSVSGLVLKNLTPTIGKPIVDVALNENFMGSSIYSENFPFGTPKPDSSMSRRSTPEGYKAVAEFLNEVSGGSQWRSGAIDINPDVMRYFVDFTAGGAGKFAFSKLPDNAYNLANGVEQPAHRTIFLSRLNGKVLPYEDQSKFYDRRDEIHQVEAEFKALKGRERVAFYQEQKGKLALRGLINTTEKQLKVMRKQRDAVYQQNLSPAAQDLKLKEVEQRMKAVVDRFNRAYGAAD